MMTHDADRDDELLRRVLREEADTVHPRPDWDDVRDRAHGRRRWRMPAAAAVAVLALIAAVLVARGGGDDQTGVVADDPDRSVPEATTDAPTTFTTRTTTTMPAMEAGPEIGPLELPSGAPLGDDELVAALQVPGDDFPSVELVVLTKETGEVVRTLADGYDTVEGGVYGLTLTPDRRTLFYVVATSACSARLEAVAVDGSADAETLSGEAGRLAISAGGDRLAVAAGDLCVAASLIDLVPTGGGQIMQYENLGDEGRGIESMAFADERTLLYVTAPTTTQGDLQLHSLDLDTGVAMQSHPAPVGTQYSSLRRRDGRITALERPEGGGAFLVTLENGEVTDRRAVEADGEVTTIAVDESGSVFAVEPGGDPRLTVDGRVLRADVIDVAL